VVDGYRIVNPRRDGHAKAALWSRDRPARNAGNAGNSPTPSRVTGSCQSLEGAGNITRNHPHTPRPDQLELAERAAIQGELGDFRGDR